MNIPAPVSVSGSSTPTGQFPFGHHVRDITTMIGRSLRLARRDPDEMIMSLRLPVAIMVLFVYVFGGAMDVGTDYVTYATPGVILLCAGYGASNTALTIATDMAVGIMDRFRSMPIATGSVLAGHIIASVCRNLLTTAVVVGVATAIGFRAENQPVTPVIEAIRGLAIGLGSDAEPVTGLGSTVTLALLWCAAIAATFLGAATWGFRRRRT